MLTELKVFLYDYILYQKLYFWINLGRILCRNNSKPFINEFLAFFSSFVVFYFFSSLHKPKKSYLIDSALVLTEANIQNCQRKGMLQCVLGFPLPFLYLILFKCKERIKLIILHRVITIIE